MEKTAVVIIVAEREGKYTGIPLGNISDKP
jgi:hypothetical protein